MPPTPKHIEKIAKELELTIHQVYATAGLLEEGSTVPFIARYRKEVTDSLDEVEITAIRDRIEQLIDLDKRREAILASMIEQNVLTDELKAKINAAETMAVLEDIYLPFKPKRRTRATIAKEKGLEPLAILILEKQDANPAIDPMKEAGKFVNPEKEVNNVEEALAGSRDIIAELISENQEVRAQLRQLFLEDCMISSKPGKNGKKESEKESKYKDYYDWKELAATSPSHRILAMMRGEKEFFLRLNITPEQEDALNILFDTFLKGDTLATQQVKLAAQESYDRLLSMSMEIETRVELKKRADETAIKVFGSNLKELLLAAPLGQKNILAIDPGFRTGCKVVCLDKQGQLLCNDTIYPHTGDYQSDNAKKTLVDLCEKFGIEAIAIGNGTAGRETESFVQKLGLPKEIMVVMVNESGASIYSASKIARDEFPDHDITVRGSVSIGRRLADPLAELVKIDPKSIGVGQYQHDVNQKALQRNLDDIVVSCVNNVGVNINTASEHLLNYVSGLSSRLSKSIVNYRNENGPFSSREDLKKIAWMGEKAFEQSAGFLRIYHSSNPLDNSAVHPESYYLVDNMANDLDCSLTDLISNKELHQKIDLKKYVSESVGLPTLQDILDELSKPGRDPREKFEAFSFSEGLNDIKDLTVGMKLPGIITNTTAFGAFVDIGVHQDGLVHISHIADNFVKDPCEVVKVQQKVIVTVMEVDVARKRISLSLKKNPVMGPAVVKKSVEKKYTDTPPVARKKSSIGNLSSSDMDALMALKAKLG